jgi:isocitrate/isopropylmalate dehydrogenase
MFEPVHGSAPPLAGKNVANPMGAILSAGLMLGHLGFADEAAAIDHAVRRVVADGIGTPDIGGTQGTIEVGTAVVSAINLDRPIPDGAEARGPEPGA